MKGKLNKLRNEKRLNDKNNPKSLKLKSINKITEQSNPTVKNNRNLDYQLNLDNIYNEDMEYEIDSYSKNVTESQRDTKHNLYMKNYVLCIYWTIDHNKLLNVFYYHVYFCIGDIN